MKYLVWQVFGLDTFEAGSRADTAGAGWYPIGNYGSEEKAMACVAGILSAYRPKNYLAEHIFLVTPAGKKFRCVLPPCPSCDVSDSMRPLKNPTDKNPDQASMAQYECEKCGLKEWRELTHIFLMRLKIR